MNKDRVSKLLAGCTHDELRCLKSCAYLMSSIDGTLFFKICDVFKLKGFEKSYIQESLEKKGLLIEAPLYQGYERASMLTPHAYIQLLIMIAKEPESEESQYKKVKKSFRYHWNKKNDDIAKERSFILNYIRYKEVTLLEHKPAVIEVDVIVEILPFFYEYEELKPLLLHIPVSLVKYLSLVYKTNAELCLEPNQWEKSKFLFGSNEVTEQVQKEITSSFNLSRFIYTGQWSVISRLEEAKLVYSLLPKAFWGQLNRNTLLAVKLYQKCANAIGKTEFIQEFFYDFMYICALMQVNTEASKAKLSILSKRILREIKVEADESLIPISLLLEIANTDDLDSIVQKITKPIFTLPVVGAFYELILEHYGLEVEFQRTPEWVEYVLQNPELKFLRSLFSIEFPHLAKKLNVPINELFISPLLPPYTKVTSWERTINLLLAKPEDNVSPKEEKTYRIIYLVDEHFDVTPKIQTLSKKGNWSKGRKIPLSNFYNGMPEMSPFDEEIAKCIELKRSYGSECYRLQGGKVLRKLIGYPYLYKDEYENMVMEVVLELPYLTIQKKENGFVVESNIENPHEVALIRCELESQSRIKITEVTARQKELLSVLSRVELFPFEAREKLQQLLYAISDDITIHSDLIATDVSITQVDGDSSIVVQLLPIGEEFKVGLYVKPFIDSAPYCTPNKGAKTVMGQGEKSSMQALRNMDAENENLKKLQNALAAFEFVDYTAILLHSPAECLEFLDIVRSLDFARIEWPEGAKLKLAGAVSASNFSISLKEKGGWFEMVGELRYNNNQTMALHELMEQFAANGNKRFISLGDNEYLALNDQLRKMLLSIQTISSKGKKEELKISEFVAPLLRNFQADGLMLKTDDSYKQLLKKIDDADKMSFKVPAMLQASLREYQEEGFRWMAKLSEWGAGACLADDMGLGKTVQTIAMLCRQAPHGPALVVAPASVVSNWKSEFAKFAPALQVSMLNEAANRSELVTNAADYGVIITTYGLLHSESSLLVAKHWKTIVLDEAHSIKNKETKMSKAAMQLEGDFRLMLTGTPVQNHLSEIWNLFQFMNPGMLGSFEQFTKRFIIPIEVGNDKEKRKELKNIITPFLLRRTKNEVLDELPGKTEIVIPVELSATEELFYETLRKRAEANLLASENNSIQTLSEITRLRQAASHIGLVDSTYKEESVKMGAFFDLVDVMKENNHRALVFSQFTSHLALFKEALDKRGIEYLYLDGSTSIAERGNLVKKFQTGTQLLFLISLKAGGLGLNLTSADFIVHLDPWWNPAIEDQASDRAYRIGQTRPVTVYRLIAKNTIEEKIIELHRTKKDLANSLLDGTNQSHKLTRDELLQLLSKA